VAYQARGAQTVLGVDPQTPVEILWSPEPFSHLEYGAEMTRIRFLAPVPPAFQVVVNWPLAVRFIDYLGRTVRTDELLDIHHAVIQVVGHWDEDMRGIADGTYGEVSDQP
jgi:hypothetical protein